MLIPSFHGMVSICLDNVSLLCINCFWDDGYLLLMYIVFFDLEV